jgi:hypothetical protein
VDRSIGCPPSVACGLHVFMVRPKCDPHADIKYSHNVLGGVTFPRVWPYFGLSKITAPMWIACGVVACWLQLPAHLLDTYPPTYLTVA